MKISVNIFAAFVFLFIYTCSAQNSKQTIREPAVSGTFYPSEPSKLTALLQSFFDSVEDKKTEDNISAIIVPHAGYVFSGQVSASAYAKLNPEKTYSRIFIIGTSHKMLLKGASVFNSGSFRTPLGLVPVDEEVANRLVEENKFISVEPEAHRTEHSIEVQLPFLQYQLKKTFKIVPIIIGTQSAETCRKIAETLNPYFNEENLFVISSDFSHYPGYKNAVETDKITGEAIASNSPLKFIEVITAKSKNDPGLVTRCCGWSSVLTLLLITSEHPEIRVNHIKYMNSGDVSNGDKQKVVGYHSFIFTREILKKSSESFSLTSSDKKILLTLARETIENQLNKKPLPKVDENKLSDVAKTNCGIFVTLTKNKALRGCIGRFVFEEPLYKVVQQMALAAAFEDTRFAPVRLKDFNEIEIEISVLTPLKRIHSINEFEYGKQGIYMIKGKQSGTFLPQVAKETKWTKEEFLGHCARDKAGIGWDGWKNANLYTYEAYVFNENETTNPER